VWDCERLSGAVLREQLIRWVISPQLFSNLKRFCDENWLCFTDVLESGHILQASHMCLLRHTEGGSPGAIENCVGRDDSLLGRLCERIVSQRLVTAIEYGSPTNSVPKGRGTLDA